MAGMFEIHVKSDFAAAHSLAGYEGDCAGIHGHNWTVETHVQCSKLDAIGIGIDFRQIKATVEKILEELDHRYLNDLEAFRAQNPTSENLARYLYGQMSARLNTPNVRVSRVKVSETEGTGAVYWEEP